MQKVKTAWVGGGLGFIGHHMARRLKSEGYWVRVVDIKEYEYGNPLEFCDEFIIADLRDKSRVESTLRINSNREYSYFQEAFEETFEFDEAYNFACQMGGAGYVFVGVNDCEIMHDSALINLNIADTLKGYKTKLFYSSSACMYPHELQNENGAGAYSDFRSKFYTYSLKESDAYKGPPDSEYGWEKLFSERLYLAYARNYGLDIRIARFHNIYGPEGTYTGGKEKAPAAMCRKVVDMANHINHLGKYENEKAQNFNIEVWGTGNQTRSFLYIDDCIDAVRLLMESDFKEPINIGSEEMVTINELAQMAIDISGKDIKIVNVASNAVGVMGRNSNNELIEKVLGWKPKYTLRQGMELTFNWIKSMYEKNSG